MTFDPPTTHIPPKGIAPRPAVAFAIAVVVAAAVARAVLVGNDDLWADEAASVAFARLSTSELVAVLREDSGPPLYYLLLRGVIAVFGEGDLAVRAPGLLAGVAVVAAVVFAPRCSRRAHLVAGLVLAVSPLMAASAVWARAYSLTCLLLWLAHLALCDIVVHQRVRAVVALALCDALALYTHNGALYAIAAQVVAVAVVAPRASRALPLTVVGCAGAGALYLPWLGVLWSQVTTPTSHRWMSELYAAEGPARLAHKSLATLFPGGPVPGYVRAGSLPWGDLFPAALVVGIVVVAAYGALGVRAGDAGDGDDDTRGDADARRTCARVTLVELAALLVVPLVVAELFVPGVLPGRTNLAALPLFAIAVGLAVEVLPAAPGRAIVVAMVVAGVFGIGIDVSDAQSGSRSAAAALADATEDGDVVVFAALTHGPADVELRRRGRAVQPVTYPGGLVGHPGRYDAYQLIENPEGAAAEAERALDEALLRPVAPARIFFVYVDTPATRPLLAALARRRELGRVRLLGSWPDSVFAQRLELYEVECRLPPQ